MDWQNERYVRIYTRDTTAMLMMAWDELALFWALIRKVDRAGVLDLDGHGAGALVAHLRCPLEEAKRALKAWQEAGWVEVRGDLLLVPSHMPAQEARQSDAQRKRNSREQRRATARLDRAITSAGSVQALAPSEGGDGESVTSRDATPGDRGERSRDAQEPERLVTQHHTASREVTPSQAQQSQTRQSFAVAERARPRAPDTSSRKLVPSVRCEVCGGVGRLERWGRCKVCDGQGRHLAGGADSNTIVLARLLAKIVPEVNHSKVAFELTGLWTSRHTEAIAEKAFRQCAVEIGSDWTEQRAARLIRIYFENAPSHHERAEGRATSDRGRRSERAHLVTKTPEERARREGRVRRDRAAEVASEQKLMSVAEGAKMALAAMQSRSAEQATELKRAPLEEASKSVAPVLGRTVSSRQSHG